MELGVCLPVLHLHGGMGSQTEDVKLLPVSITRSVVIKHFGVVYQVVAVPHIVLCSCLMI